MNKIRPFKPELYKKCDKIGKQAIIDFFNENLPGCEVIVEPYGKFGVDLKIIKKDKTFIYAECEIRTIWKEGKFPYRTIHVPYRKDKFKSKNTYFITIRGDLGACYFSQLNDNTSIVEIRNTEVEGDKEPFYDVPVENCLYFDLKGNYNG